MNKKPFSLGGIILVVAFILGLIFFFGGAIFVKIKPVVYGLGIDERTISPMQLVISGFFWFVFGIIIVPAFYKTFTLKKAFSLSPNLTINVKVVSKSSFASFIFKPQPHICTSSHSQLISFEFPDGSRRNFNIPDINQFNAIKENESGLLNYKSYGDNVLFISFKQKFQD